MTLNILATQDDGFTLLSLEGEVDTKTAPQLLQALTELGLAALNELRLDLQGLQFMSSAGLRALVFAKQKMPYDSRLIVIGAREEVVDVITRTGLTQALILVASVEEIP
ncbi:MAG: STAS domain-containing protein [Prochlorococcaceae cyanobacterium]|jgi:anti-anti-sigma factor